MAVQILLRSQSLHRRTREIQLVRNSGQIIVAKDTPVLHDGNMNVRTALWWVSVGLWMGVILVVSSFFIGIAFWSLFILHS